MKKNLFIISAGGSLIVPEKGVNIRFLKSFKKVIEEEVKKGKRFIIVCGGGSVARKYQKALKRIKGTKKEEIDWIGIESTFLNASLVKSIFGKKAHPQIIKDPSKKKRFKKNIIISGGWKPGWSTDYVAVTLAEKYGAKKVLNLTGIGFVYDKNPEKFKEAEIIKEINWKDFEKLLPSKWKPGLNSPFDPIASKKAEKLDLEVAVIGGRKMKQIKNYFEGKKFTGTTIRSDIEKK